MRHESTAFLVENCLKVTERGRPASRLTIGHLMGLVAATAIFIKLASSGLLIAAIILGPLILGTLLALVERITRNLESSHELNRSAILCVTAGVSWILILPMIGLLLSFSRPPAIKTATPDRWQAIGQFAGFFTLIFSVVACLTFWVIWWQKASEQRKDEGRQAPLYFLPILFLLLLLPVLAILSFFRPVETPDGREVPAYLKISGDLERKAAPPGFRRPLPRAVTRPSGGSGPPGP